MNLLDLLAKTVKNLVKVARELDDDGKVEHKDWKLGFVKGWDEPAMISFKNLDPFTTYIGEFEGKIDDEGIYTLGLNGEMEFEETEGEFGSLESMTPTRSRWITV